MSYADEIFEKSKDDRAMIVGSEIRGAIHEVRNERDALKVQIGKLAEDNLSVQHRAAVENTRLREALQKYGEHKYWCAWYVAGLTRALITPDCNCGFDAVLRPAGAKPPDVFHAALDETNAIYGGAMGRLAGEKEGKGG
jgi:hypothetical protein